MEDPTIVGLQQLEEQGRFTQGDLAHMGLVMKKEPGIPDLQFAVLQELAIGPGVPGTDTEGSAGQVLDILLQAVHGLDQLKEGKVEVHVGSPLMRF
jgi:hypothetical protein